MSLSENQKSVLSFLVIFSILLIAAIEIRGTLHRGEARKASVTEEMIEKPALQNILEERLEAVKSGPCIPWCIQTLPGGKQTPWFGKMTPQQTQAMLLMDGDSDEARVYRQAIADALCPEPVPSPNNCGN